MWLVSYHGQRVKAVRGRAWAVVALLLFASIVAVMLLGGGSGSARPTRVVVRPDPPTPIRVSFTKWSGGSDPGLHVLPFPGTPDASPITQIIFSSLAPSQIRSVSVVASMSGRHSGHLIALPDGSGAAFVPDQPFISAETVKVVTRLRSAAAGTASGSRGSTHLRFSFGVAAPVTTPGPSADAPVPPLVGGAISASTASATSHARASTKATTSTHTASTTQATSTTKPSTPAQTTAPPAQAASHYPPSQHFHTYPGLGPPMIRSSADGDHSSGDIFLTPGNGRQHGPTIINGRGQLVWFDHISNRTDVSNLEVKTYQGKPVLTWWQGKFSGGHGIDGRGVIMSRRYHILKVVQAGEGYTSDLHEFQVTPQGTAFVDCYVPVHANLTSQGGPPNGVVLDGVVQKIDVRTGRVLWEWHALGHVPITASYIGDSGAGGPYDYFHLNSIEELPGGKVLISARNTWAAYLIDERTGRIDWTLGGKNSNFRTGPGAGFQWQHDVVLQRNGLLTVFDDAAVPSDQPYSSGKLIRINQSARTATLVKNYVHSPPVTASYMGSTQLLPNNNVFMGWGNTDNFSEYSQSGRQIYNGMFLGGINTYRAYRFRWNGQPTQPPAMALSPGPDGAVQVYSGWNGATRVARWRVLGGASAKSLGGLGLASNAGFETGQWVHGEPRFFAVEGIDARGHVLGRSAVMARPSSTAVYGPSVFVSSSTGGGTLPVSCFTLHSTGCSVKATLTVGKTVLASTSREAFQADHAGLLRFRLSSAGRSMLASAHGHQLAVQVSAEDSSGHTAMRHIELVQFTDSGAGPSRTMSAAPTVELLGGTDFASSSGQGAILGACYAAIRCSLTGSLSVGSKTIATIPQRNLGANEAGYTPFQLTATGKRMLARAAGNQLAVRVRLRNGSDLATGQIALVRYS